MDAKTLQRENAMLKKRLKQVEEQHDAVVQQFVLTLQEKERKVAALEHRIKLLLQKIRGSRQERIDPDQLMLFSLEELQELADELENQAAQETDQADDELPHRRKRRGRRRLPKDMQREILRHELTDQQRRRARAAVNYGARLVSRAVSNLSTFQRVGKSSSTIESNTLAAHARKMWRSPTSHRSRSKKDYPVLDFAPIRCCRSLATTHRFTGKKTFTLAPVIRFAAVRCAVGCKRWRRSHCRW